MIFYKSKVTVMTQSIKGTYNDISIRVTKWPTKLGEFFKIKPKERNYEGGSTVFYEIKNDFRTRCSTLTESWLSDIYYNFKRKK